MKHRLPSLIAAMAAASIGAQDATTFRDTPAQDLFRYARGSVVRNVGAIARLKTLAFKGKSRLGATDGSLVDASVTVKILLPDYYLRVDSTSTGERLEGYAGSKLLNVMRAPGRMMAPPDSEKAQILRVERAALARLMLGMVTYVSTEQPMTFQSRGTPVQMPGQSDPLGLDVTDEKNTGLLRFIVDHDTRVPARLVFWGPERSALTMTFADRRDVDGMLLPFHITTASDTRTLDELIFEEMLVNPPLTKADFSAR